MAELTDQLPSQYYTHAVLFFFYTKLVFYKHTHTGPDPTFSLTLNSGCYRLYQQCARVYYRGHARDHTLQKFVTGTVLLNWPLLSNFFLFFWTNKRREEVD